MVEQKLSPFDEFMALMVVKAIGESGRVLQEHEIDDLASTIVRAIDRKRAEKARVSDEAQRQSRATAEAEAYLVQWINENTGEPWYCQRIADEAKAGRIIQQTPGMPGQRAWLRAFLEGRHKDLEAWVLAEAKRQATQYQDFPIEVHAPSEAQIEEMRR